MGRREGGGSFSEIPTSHAPSKFNSCLIRNFVLAYSTQRNLHIIMLSHLLDGAMRLSTSVTASAGLVEVYYNGV